MPSPPPGGAGSPSRGSDAVRVEAMRTYKGASKIAWRNPRRLLGGSGSEAETHRGKAGGRQGTEGSQR